MGQLEQLSSGVLDMHTGWPPEPRGPQPTTTPSTQSTQHIAKSGWLKGEKVADLLFCRFSATF